MGGRVAWLAASKSPTAIASWKERHAALATRMLERTATHLKNHTTEKLGNPWNQVNFHQEPSIFFGWSWWKNGGKEDRNLYHTTSGRPDNKIHDSFRSRKCGYWILAILGVGKLPYISRKTYSPYRWVFLHFRYLKLFGQKKPIISLKYTKLYIQLHFVFEIIESPWPNQIDMKRTDHHSCTMVNYRLTPQMLKSSCENDHMFSGEIVYIYIYMGISKNRGIPKMDGL